LLNLNKNLKGLFSFMSSTPKDLIDKLPREIWKEICFHALPRKIYSVDFVNFHYSIYPVVDKINLVLKNQTYIWAEYVIHGGESYVCEMKNARVGVGCDGKPLLVIYDIVSGKATTNILLHNILRVEKEKFERIKRKGFITSEEAMNYKAYLEKSADYYCSYFYIKDIELQ
jgi:hypothetical protein